MPRTELIPTMNGIIAMKNEIATYVWKSWQCQAALGLIGNQGVVVWNHDTTASSKQAMSSWLRSLRRRLILE